LPQQSAEGPVHGSSHLLQRGFAQNCLQTPAFAQRRGEGVRLAGALNTLHHRRDTAYRDKLNGKITEEFWQRIQADFQKDKLRIKRSDCGVKGDGSRGPLAGSTPSFLELAQSAHSIYVE
jgi:hypothetical protein